MFPCACQRIIRVWRLGLKASVSWTQTRTQKHTSHTRKSTCVCTQTAAHRTVKFKNRCRTRGCIVGPLPTIFLPIHGVRLPRWPSWYAHICLSASFLSQTHTYNTHVRVYVCACIYKISLPPSLYIHTHTHTHTHNTRIDICIMCRCVITWIAAPADANMQTF